MDQAPGFKKLFNNKNNKSNDIYEELEGTIDEFYDKLEAAKRKQPDMEW